MKTKDIWAEFSDKLVQSLEKRPPGEGWMTVEELAKRFNLTHNGATSMIKRRRKMLEVFMGRAMATNGNVLAKAWYRPLTAPRAAGMEPVRRRPARSP